MKSGGVRHWMKHVHIHETRYVLPSENKKHSAITEHVRFFGRYPNTSVYALFRTSLIPDLLTLLHVKSPCFHASTPISSKISNCLRAIGAVETRFCRFSKIFPFPRPTNFAAVTQSSARPKISQKIGLKTSSETRLLSPFIYFCNFCEIM